MADELDALLGEIGRRGYLLYSFRTDLHGPEILAAVYDYGGTADVVVLFAADHAVAYRTPTGPGLDVFAPERVYWMYGGSPIWTLRALLTLAPPADPHAPTALVEAPPGLRRPTAERLPVRIVRRRGR